MPGKLKTMPGKLKTTPGGKGNSYKGCGRSSFVFAVAGIRLFFLLLLHSGAMCINLGSFLLSYHTGTLVCCSSFTIVVSTYFLNILVTAEHLCCFLESLCK